MWATWKVPWTPAPSARLGDWWLVIHVALILLGYAALTLTFVAGVMYLIQENELKSKRPRAFYYRLPPLNKLDEMAYQTLAVGFVFITLGIIAGSFWAFVRFGSEWIVDPTIALAFVTWVDLSRHGLQPRRDRLAGTQGGVFRDCGLCLRRPDLDRQQRRAYFREVMSVLLLGLSHKTAPVEVRERFAIAEQDAGAMVGELVRRPGIAEAMVLSTCNRVEFLVRSETEPRPRPAS